MIRFDAIPLMGLPQVRKIALPEPYTVRINCVLQSGYLSHHQELEVRVNGDLQVGRREGDQSVFTWQVFRASDEIHIALLSKGIRMKYWQGCWNERDAILHAGTLPVHVFFNGKPQPLMEVPSLTGTGVPSSPVEAVNGNGNTPTIVLEHKDEKNGGEGGDVTRREQGKSTIFLQDLLVIAEPRPSSEASQEKERILNEEQQEEEESTVDQEGMEESQWGEGESASRLEERESNEEAQWRGEEGGADEGEDGEDQWEESDFDMGERQREDVLDVDTAKERDVDFSLSEGDELVREEEQQSLPATGRRVAAFHAGPLAAEETLQALKRLVATMPPKTLIVDIRPKSRQRKSSQGQDSLSKSHLRSVFGARYWDRCWAIQITPQTIPLTDRDGNATWRYVISTPESHPDGIPSLTKKLEEGYSIVVIDSSVTYAMSRRRAVIEELQQRVSGLDVGPLG